MMHLPDTICLTTHPWVMAQIAQWWDCQPDHRWIYQTARRLAPVPSDHHNAPQAAEASESAAGVQRLFHSIRLLGMDDAYRKVEPYQSATGQVRAGDPITVDIGPTGDILVRDGMHRIFYLSLLGAPNIMATVGKRDPRWLAFCQRIHDVTGQDYTYERLPHPDFDGWQVTREETRGRRVAPLLAKHGIKSLLDLGCCYGTFLMDIGPLVDKARGVDGWGPFCDVARWVVKRYPSPCFDGGAGDDGPIWCGDITQYLDSHRESFDLVAALSVLHHVASAPDGVAGVVSVLRKIADRSRFLLTEIPAASEAILEKCQPAARELVADEADVLASGGWRLLHDLGPDSSFRGGHRVLKIWERAA